MEHNTSRKQSFVGVVVKTAMKDTATVKVDRYVKNAKYKKYFVRSQKYLAHDPGNTVQVGDTVTIVATRPISKLKRFAIDPTKTVSSNEPSEDSYTSGGEN
jgi:small subunit ribosomal protein S17